MPGTKSFPRAVGGNPLTRLASTVNRHSGCPITRAVKRAGRTETLVRLFEFLPQVGHDMPLPSFPRAVDGNPLTRLASTVNRHSGCPIEAFGHDVLRLSFVGADPRVCPRGSTGKSHE